MTTEVWFTCCLHCVKLLLFSRNDKKAMLHHTAILHWQDILGHIISPLLLACHYYRLKHFKQHIFFNCCLQPLCRDEWLHHCTKGPVHRQRHDHTLPIPSSSIQLRHPTTQPLPTIPHPHQPAGGCRGASTTRNTHAHWGGVRALNYKCLLVLVVVL